MIDLDELIAEARVHVPYPAIMDDARWCMRCADEWPCVTSRLADALEVSEKRRAAVLRMYDEVVEARQVDEVAARERDAALAAVERARQAEAELRDVLRVDIPSLKAERDAALAAIERVREIVSDPCSEGCCDFCEGKNEGWEMVLQALDGAPEPDNDDPCDAEVHSWDHFRPEQIDSYWIRCTMPGKHNEHEDSHTGLKWRSGLPVEGESE